MTLSTKPEVHNNKPEEDRAAATVNMHRKLVKFVHVVFEICEQTDRHTLIAVVRTALGGEVITMIDRN